MRRAVQREMRDITIQERHDAMQVFPKMTNRTTFIAVTEKKFAIDAADKKPTELEANVQANFGSSDFIVLIGKSVEHRKFFAWYWEAKDRCYFYVGNG